MRIEQCEFADLPKTMVAQARREGADLDQALKSPWAFFRASLGLQTFGFVGVLLRTPEVVTIRGWYVAPKYRGQGIGTALLEAAMTYAIEKKVTKVELRTNQERIAHRLGFEWTGYERERGNKERHFVKHI